MALSKALLEKIYSLNERGIKLGLENMGKAMSASGIDLKGTRIIHIAGTNGKGSTAATLYSLLREQRPDINVGLYTSPHLVEYNERIVVNDKMISDEEVAELSEAIFKMTSQIPITFFEFTTLLAFMYFKHKNVNYAVVEVGLGGKLDATNVVEPDVAIITSIDMDHMEYLGNSLESIALEKAGIFKKGSKAIISRTNCSELLQNEALKKGLNPVYTMGQNFDYHLNSDGSFDLIKDKKTLYKGLNKKLNGDHQYKNASCAIMAMELLGISGTRESVSRALNKVSWKGRLEELQINGKTIIIDVSHNKEGMLATAEFMKAKYPDKKIYTACGFMNDKDYNSMIDIISTFSQKMFLIPTIVKGRELGISGYKQALSKHHEKAILCNDYKDAFNKVTDNDGVILFTGSIYNYEQLKALLGV